MDQGSHSWVLPLSLCALHTYTHMFSFCYTFLSSIHRSLFEQHV